MSWVAKRFLRDRHSSVVREAANIANGKANYFRLVRTTGLIITIMARGHEGKFESKSASGIALLVDCPPTARRGKTDRSVMISESHGNLLHHVPRGRDRPLDFLSRAEAAEGEFHDVNHDRADNRQDLR